MSDTENTSSTESGPRPRLPAAGVATTLGWRIRYLRKALRLSQKEFADRLGVHHDTISIWERDEGAPTRSNLNAIAVSTAAPLEWLESGSGEWRGIDEHVGDVSAAARESAPALEAAYREAVGEVTIQFLLNDQDVPAPRVIHWLGTLHQAGLFDISRFLDATEHGAPTPPPPHEQPRP